MVSNVSMLMPHSSKLITLCDLCDPCGIKYNSAAQCAALGPINAANMQGRLENLELGKPT